MRTGFSLLTIWDFNCDGDDFLVVGIHHAAGGNLQESAEQVAEILRSTMEEIAPELKIKLKVDVHIGKNWGEL